MNKGFSSSFVRGFNVNFFFFSSFSRGFNVNFFFSSFMRGFQCE